MTYEEILKLWHESQANWQNYRYSVSAIGGFIYSYLKERLSISGEKKEHLFKMIPPNERDEEKLRNTRYSPFGCVELKDDGWAEFGIILLLEQNENSWPKQQYRFILNIRKTSKNWNVKISNSGIISELSFEPNKDELNLLGEEFDNLLKFHTIESLNKWLGIENE